MLIKVSVRTGEKKYQLRKKKEDSFEVSVKEKPENGEANKAMIQLIASYFAVPAGRVKIIKGSRQPHKIVEIDL